MLFWFSNLTVQQVPPIRYYFFLLCNTSIVNLQNFITFFAANALQSANFVLQYLFKFNLAMYSLQHNADYVASKPMTKTFSVMLFRILGVSIYFFDWILYNTLTLCYNICRFMNFCVCFLRHNSNQIDI